MVRTLGIDFGTKRVGLALSYGTLAEPHCVVNNDEAIFAHIQQIILDEGVQQLICGISEGEMAVKTKQFATQLHLYTKLPLDFVDETLSSQSVRAKLGVRRTVNRRDSVDHFAAAEILQEWLDMQSAKEYA
ncbi:MAG: Holliday junction resolvase RuvX [Candidatus Pacebacteria bacterium]|nr:Holliday junction resolvase RuvX [Candidatus Paceibacterota bacterium]PIR60363.1 MAG: Holliday junction resolvase RuvX [Candidatus Pacebacteria bacterium CG10_big_fil_rev_8_21_14_0_10_44_54]